VTAKANLVHVPYKGGGPAMSDLLGGQIRRCSPRDHGDPAGESGQAARARNDRREALGDHARRSYDSGAGLPGI